MARRHGVASGAGEPDAPAAPDAVPAAPVTPSWLTGEFYVALAPLVAGLITVATGQHVVAADVKDTLVAVGAVVAGVYALARTVLKMVHTHAAATVARAQAIAAAQAAAARPAPPPVDVTAIAAAVVDQLAARSISTTTKARSSR